MISGLGRSAWWVVIFALGALRERLQAEDEQRDRGASERRRGRAARPRIVAGIWAVPRGIYPQGWLLPGGRVAASHLRLLRQGAF